MVQSRGKEKMEITTQFWKGKKKLKQVKIFVCDLSHSFGKRLPSSVVFKVSLCPSLSKNAFLTVTLNSYVVNGFSWSTSTSNWFFKILFRIISPPSDRYDKTRSLNFSSLSNWIPILTDRAFLLIIEIFTCDGLPTRWSSN